MRFRLPSIGPAALLLALVLLSSMVVEAAPPMQGSDVTFCKCNCFGNSTTIPLNFPSDPVHPCLSCTKQFCLDQNLVICKGASAGDGDMDTGTGKEGSDVEAMCFKRGSSRDQIIVSLFLFTIFALLLTTFLRRHLLKTGLTPLEVWAIVRTRLPPWAGGGEETASGAQRGAGQTGRGETSERGYVPVSMR